MVRISRIISVVLPMALVALGATASAATTTGIATFSPLAGDPTAYTTTMQLPGTGYPEATVTSDSRAGGVGVQSGASTWFGATSPPGERFGSSRDQGYLNLRPKADNAASPSHTTYTFARPAPRGWGFVLGDIDSDEVRVTATLADGSPAEVDDLGFRSTFNLCETAPRPSGCSTAQAKDTPTWIPSDATLRGNPAAEDTYGAAGWFVPTARLKTLTFTFTRRAGAPVYQTWFAARAQDVTGTVTVGSGSCSLSGAELHLVDADGTELARTTPADDGTYAFDDVAASDDFSVRLDGLPADCATEGPATRAVDLRRDDDTADFSVDQVVPGTGTVAGHVTRAGSGEPVKGASVSVTGPKAFDETRTSDADGAWTVVDVPAGTYTVTLTAPAGFEVVGSAERTVTVTDAGGTFPDEDFTVRPVVVPGVVSGHVLDADGRPVADAAVEVRGPDSFGTTVRTATDGSYTVPDLPAGDYTAELTAPRGTEVVGARTRAFTVTDDGDPVTVDFVVRAVVPAGGGTTTTTGSPGSTTGATTTTTGSTARTLPGTGGVDLAWLYAGGGLLLTGAGCLLVARRRRPAGTCPSAVSHVLDDGHGTKNETRSW